MDAVLLGIFREESLERVDRMSATLLAAEAGGGDADSIAQLFREVHSIKGSAGMFGLDQISALASTIEDVLARSRDRSELSPRAIPALLAAVDAIRDAVTDDLGGLEPAAEGLRALNGDENSSGNGDANGAGNGAAPAVVAPAPLPAPLAAPSLPPERTLRVRAEKIDKLLASVGETALHRRRLEHLTNGSAQDDERLREELEHGQVLIDDLRDEVLDLRMLPLETIAGGLTRAVRDTAAQAGRDVELKLSGTTTPLDRTILDGISDALVHLLRNAVSHGIEAARGTRGGRQAADGDRRASRQRSAVDWSR